MTSQSASTSRTVRFVRSAGTFIDSLEVSRGDICQLYDDNGNVSPVYQSSDPLRVAFRHFDTKTVSPVVFPADNDGNNVFDWFLGSVDTPGQIQFAPDGAALGKYAGVFRKRPGGVLEVIGNLALALDYTSTTLFCRLTSYNSSGGRETFAAHAPVTVIKAVDNSWNCSVYGSPSLTVTSGVPGTDGYSVTLHAALFRGISEIAEADYGLEKIKLKWYRRDASGTWVFLAEAPSLVMTADDIGSQEVVLCRVYRDGGAEPVCADTAPVYDDSDPFVINPNPDPADETIYETAGSNNKVTYRPFLCTAENPESNIESGGGRVFDFSLFGPSGEDVTGADASGVTSFTVTLDHVRGVNADLTVYISTNI